MTDTRYHPPMPEREPETPPAPRPTCGTCPHWDAEDGEDSGYCTFWPLPGDAFVYKPSIAYCGQHPEMDAWIRDEWPKVRAGR